MHLSAAQISTLIATYKYPVLIPIAVFEGPIAALLVGFLASNGVFNIFVAYLIFSLCDVVGDTVFYSIGRAGKKKDMLEKVTKLIGLKGHHETVRYLWFHHGRKAMFFGKLAFGLPGPILISAGLVKLPFKTFMSYAVPISFLQYAVFLFVGYYFGEQYKTLSKDITYAGYIIAAAIIIFVAAFFLFKKYITNNLSSLRD